MTPTGAKAGQKRPRDRIPGAEGAWKDLSVELVDLPGQAVELDGQLSALIAGEVGEGGDRPVLHLVVEAGVHGAQVSHSWVFLPSASGRPSMTRKMEEMAIIMAR